MKDFFKTIADSIMEEATSFLNERYQSYKEEAKIARLIVAGEWFELIEKEGMEAAKRFMQECRERQISPSSHLDLTDFLEAGKAAMKAHFRSQINSTIWK